VYFWLGIFVGLLAFSMYFVVDKTGTAHGFWHIGVALDFYFWLKVYYTFFRDDPKPTKQTKKTSDIVTVLADNKSLF
jgi:hypothetical protein